MQLNAASVALGLNVVAFVSEFEGEEVRIPKVSVLTSGAGVIKGMKAICKANNLQMIVEDDDIVLKRKD